MNRDPGGDIDYTAAETRVVQRAAAGRDFTGVEELVTTRGSRQVNQVALTFDDGPVARTADVLAALDRTGAKGTFFLVGQKIAGHESLLRRMVHDGHEIGNHSFAHPAFPDEADVGSTSELIESVTGAAPALFRPPFGGIDRPGAIAARRAGMSVILWDVSSEDVLPAWVGIGPDEVYDNVIDHVRPGSIVLMHDGCSWSRAGEALPAMIATLRERGLELVTVSTLLASDPRPGRRPR